MNIANPWPVDPVEQTELLQMEEEVEQAQRERMKQWKAELATMDRHARDREKHRAPRRHKQALRRAKEHNALLPGTTQAQLDAMLRKYEKAVEREFWNGEPHEVHHKIALHGESEETGEQIVCGLHVPWNLVVMTREENRKLGATVSDDLLGFDPFNPKQGDGDDWIPF